MARAGDLELLDHPVTQSLLSSKEPAQLAYTWLDRTPRNIPILFHWDGAAIASEPSRMHPRSSHCAPTRKWQSALASTPCPTRCYTCAASPR
jgi:hypothetical protein